MDGSMDGSIDGSMDGSGPDGSVDGSMGDGGVEVFPGCTDTVFQEIDLGSDVRGFQQTISVAPAAAGFGLAWSDASDAFENIRARVVPSTGPLGTNHDVTTDFSAAGGASILSLGSTFLTAYFDNSDFSAGYEVYLRPLDATGTPTGTAARLTTNMVRDDNPNLLGMGSSNLVVWVEDDLTNRVAKAALVSDTGTIMGSVQTLTTPPEAPTNPVLSPLMGGAGFAWAEGTAAGRDAVLIRLDSAGARVSGSRVVLSTEHNASGGVDLATNDATGGAAVFDVNVADVRPEVRFREVAADGSLPGPEGVVSRTPATGRDASIAPLAGGWVVAYRALPDGSLTEPTLRLTLLDLRGEILNSFEGPTMMAQGGRTTLRVAADGRVLVAWEDEDERDGSRRMRAVRVGCAAEGPGVDGGVPDAGTDSGTDAGMDASLPDGGIDPCVAFSVPECGAGDTCGVNETCVDDGCGTRRCVPAGHVCVAVDDCPSGSSCTTGASGGVCQRPGGGCSDSRDCPLGFACEVSACVDRRSLCDSSLQCPKGFVCTGPGLGTPFCVPVHLPCTVDCSAGSCVDADGDGDKECVFAGPDCTVNSDCPSGSVCGSAPSGVCGDFGPCSSASDCPATYLCQDLYGDGVPVCVAPSGTCSGTADCPTAQICAVPRAGGAPRCM